MIRTIICCGLVFLLTSPRSGFHRTDTLQMLGKPLPVELNFTNVPLAQVLDRFVELTHARLNIQWDKLQAQNITPASPVIARLKNVRAYKYLGTVLNDAGGGNVRLTYFVEDDGDILITTLDDFYRTHTLTIDYEISDLVNDPKAAKRAANVQQLIVNLDIGPDHGWREPDESARAAGYGATELNGILTVRESARKHQEILHGLEELRAAAAMAYIRRAFW